MLAKIAGQDRFKVGNGKSSWSELPWSPAVSGNNGLVYKDGELIVDFAQMPTDKFEAIVKSLKVKIWLTENTNFYVDGTNGSDVLSEDRGLSEDKAFKTIQACVDYVCERYNLNKYNAIIYVNPEPEYLENLKLPDYTKTEGNIVIKPLNFELDDTQYIKLNFICPEIYIGNWLESIQVSGTGIWYLYNFKINVFINFNNFQINDNNDITIIWLFPINVVQSATAIFSSINCNINISGNLPHSISALSVNVFQTRDNGEIKFIVGKTLSSGVNITNSVTGAASEVNVLTLQPNTKMQLTGSPSTSSSYNRKFIVSGSFLYFLYNTGGAFFITNTPDTSMYFESAGSVIGNRYFISQGGSALVRGAGENFFPGSIKGTVEASTYSWYR